MKGTSGDAVKSLLNGTKQHGRKRAKPAVHQSQRLPQDKAK